MPLQSTTSTVGVAIGAAVLVAGITGAATSAPAAAVVTGFTLESPSAGGAYGTSCSYKITVSVDTPDGAVILLEGSTGLNNEIARQNPTGTTATFTWTPKTEGTRTLTVSQLKGKFMGPSRAKTVTVKKGIDLGSTCLVL